MMQLAFHTSWGANSACECCKNVSERCSIKRASRLCGPSLLLSFSVGEKRVEGLPSAGERMDKSGASSDSIGVKWCDGRAKENVSLPRQADKLPSSWSQFSYN